MQKRDKEGCADVVVKAGKMYFIFLADKERAGANRENAQMILAARESNIGFHRLCLWGRKSRAASSRGISMLEKIQWNRQS